MPYGYAVKPGDDAWLAQVDEFVARIKRDGRLQAAATYGASLGLEIHAGHGLTFDNVGPVAAIPELAELNIGHFLIGAAVFSGLPAAIAEMRTRMDAARA